MLPAVTLLIGPFGKQRLAVEHFVSSEQSQHSLEAVTKTSLQESRVRVAKSYLELPLSFEANRGQTDAQVKFLSRGQGYTLFLTRRADAVLALCEPAPKGGRQEAVAQGAGFKALQSRADNRTAVVRMHVVGGNARPEVEGVDELPGKANYFIGKDPTQWRRKVPLFSKVIYRQVYRGVDLVYYGQQRELEHDFVVAPGSDPRSITLRFAGTKAMSLDSSGALVLEVHGSQVRFEKPRIYQEVHGTRKEVPGGYVLKNGHEIGFEVASYDASKPLVIDPTLSYSTYLGGSRYDQGLGIAVDEAGNAYITGSTFSADFPITPGAFQMSIAPNRTGAIAFVTALNSDGSGLIYSTYLGGSASDQGLGIAVDAAGNAYVTGNTDSRDFPTTPGAFQSAKPGRHNAFVTALNSDGSGLIYSTYLGGSDFDQGHAIAVDAAGNAYVTGLTYSTDFPTTVDAFQSAKGNPSDFIYSAFVTALNSDGSGLIYSTYLGGSDSDSGAGIAVRQRHRENQEHHERTVQMYVTGNARSADFPTTPGAFQSTRPGSHNVFVTALNSDGSGLVYSTYLGGSLFEEGHGIAVDAAGNAYVTGSSGSRDFPTTPGAFQTSIGPSRPGTIAFVTRLNSDGSGLVYSTYLGGGEFDVSNGIAVDAAGNAYVTGYTTSTDFPTTPDAFQSAKPGIENAFVTALNSDGSGLIYSTYLGGSSFDQGWGIAVRQRHREGQEDHEARRGVQVYVTGQTESPDFPITPNAFQPALAGGRPEAFVARISGFQQ
jgi:hypothetical protein